jgi:hypothetical protein
VWGVPTLLSFLAAAGGEIKGPHNTNNKIKATEDSKYAIGMEMTTKMSACRGNV